jgi:hypothetical protein
MQIMASRKVRRWIADRRTAIEMMRTEYAKRLHNETPIPKRRILPFVIEEIRLQRQRNKYGFSFPAKVIP